MIGAAEPEIVFCRGVTEGLNLMARAFEKDGLGPDAEVLVTEAEHYSNIVPWLLACESTGAALRAAPIRDDADLDMDAFAAMLTDRVKVIAATHVSNVTGTVYPVAEITRLAHARGIPVLIDGA